MSCNNVQILNFNHNIVEVGPDNKIVITDQVKCNSITIPQPVTNILQINSPGPQGTTGPQGPVGNVPYKSYTAIYTQQGTLPIDSEPPLLVNVLENTINPGITPAVGFITDGIFSIDFTGAYLTNGKTFVMCNMWGDNYATPRPASGYPYSDSIVYFGTTGGVNGNNYILIEVRVYN